MAKEKIILLKVSEEQIQQADDAFDEFMPMPAQSHEEITDELIEQICELSTQAQSEYTFAILDELLEQKHTSLVYGMEEIRAQFFPDEGEGFAFAHGFVRGVELLSPEMKDVPLSDFYVDKLMFLSRKAAAKAGDPNKSNLRRLTSVLDKSFISWRNQDLSEIDQEYRAPYIMGSSFGIAGFLMREYRERNRKYTPAR